jgi:hypothetical protein
VSRAGLRRRAAAVADTPIARLLAIGLIVGSSIAAALAVFLVDRRESTTRVLEGPITVERALSTTAALFGDPVAAEIDVYTSDRSIASRSVRVTTGFRPYRITATRITRERQGDISLLRTRITLECLTRTCLPPKGGARVVRFPPFAVTYRRGGQGARVVVPWEPFQVSSRLPRGAAAGVGIIDTAPLLEQGFDRSPDTVRALSLVVAVALGLAGAALVLTTLWPSSAAQRRLRRLSPLERSLLRVEAAAASDDEATRRRTLDDLATQLGGLPAPSLERRTRALAWGKSPPEPEALALLAEHVRAALNGGVRT